MHLWKQIIHARFWKIQNTKNLTKGKDTKDRDNSVKGDPVITVITNPIPVLENKTEASTKIYKTVKDNPFEILHKFRYSTLGNNSDIRHEFQEFTVIQKQMPINYTRPNRLLFIRMDKT